MSSVSKDARVQTLRSLAVVAALSMLSVLESQLAAVEASYFKCGGPDVSPFSSPSGTPNKRQANIVREMNSHFSNFGKERITDSTERDYIAQKGQVSLEIDVDYNLKIELAQMGNWYEEKLAPSEVISDTDKNSEKHRYHSIKHPETTIDFYPHRHALEITNVGANGKHWGPFYRTSYEDTHDSSTPQKHETFVFACVKLGF